MQYLRMSASMVGLIATLGATTLAQAAFDVKWVNEKLTIKSAGAPLAAVVADVAKKTDIEVVGSEKLRGPLTIDIAEFPVERALTALLAGVNYSIQKKETPAGTRMSVRILSMSGADLPDEALSGPILSPALDAFIAEAALDVEEQREMDAEDPDHVEEVRQEAAEARKLAEVGAFGPKVDIATLVKFMANYNDEIRLQAIHALGARAIGQVLQPVASVLGDEFWEVRTEAVEALGRARDPESLQVVGQLLMKHDDVEVRVDALRVLARRAQPESAVYLRAALKDAEAIVREAAGQILDELERREEAKRAKRR